MRSIWRVGTAGTRGASSRASAVALLLCVLLLGGCRLGFTVEATVEADGDGNVAVVADLDATMLGELDRLGIDPTAELEAAAATSPGWQVTRLQQESGGLVVRADRPVGTVSELGDTLRALTDGLAERDPAVVVDLDVEVDDDGASAVTGTATFRPPATSGLSVDGEPLGPDGDELAAIVASAVDAQLRVRLPGRVLAHDGARVEDRTVVWDLPVGETVELAATAAPPSWWEPVVAALSGDGAAGRTAAVAAGLVVLAVAVGLLVRRAVRRSE